MGLYEAADCVESSDNTIEIIVKEMSGSFFAGDRSAEETAKLIQGRFSYIRGNRSRSKQLERNEQSGLTAGIKPDCSFVLHLLCIHG